ncbi:MRL1 [Acrasis kona]|uniref:MRL1 n=1 Tax=Acrasis kona TaxID=1008807 RepID=A0AAW2YT13_9EUKA
MLRANTRATRILNSDKILFASIRNYATNKYNFVRGVPVPLPHQMKTMMKPREKMIRTRNVEIERKDKVEARDKLDVYDIWVKQGHELNIYGIKEMLGNCIEISTPQDSYGVKKGLEILAQAKKSGFPMDNELYLYMMQTATRNHDYDLVLQVFSWFERDNIEIDSQVYMCLIRACSLVDKPKEAKEWYDILMKKELAPSFLQFPRLYNQLKNF